jgi:hypothetical protein
MLFKRVPGFIFEFLMFGGLIWAIRQVASRSGDDRVEDFLAPVAGENKAIPIVDCATFVHPRTNVDPY